MLYRRDSFCRVFPHGVKATNILHIRPLSLHELVKLVPFYYVELVKLVSLR
jgi:hypothetical protein